MLKLPYTKMVLSIFILILKIESINKTTKFGNPYLEEYQFFDQTNSALYLQVPISCLISHMLLQPLLPSIPVIEKIYSTPQEQEFMLQYKEYATKYFVDLHKS